MDLIRDKIYRDRAGNKWRVVCVDAGQGYPVIAYSISEVFGPCRFASDGRFVSQGGHDCDLISEAKEPREFFVVLDENGVVMTFNEGNGHQDIHSATKAAFLGKEAIRLREILDDENRG